MKNGKLLIVCIAAAIAFSGCSNSVTETELSVTSSGTSESNTEIIVSNESETNAETTPINESGIYCLSPIISESNNDLLQDMRNFTLSEMDSIGNVGSNCVAIIHLNPIGNYSPDSDVPQISSSVIIVKDFEGNEIYQNEVNSTIIPQVVFDEDNNLHVFLSDWGNTQHFAYDSVGGLLPEMNYSLDFFVNPMITAFDRNGYLYAINYDWAFGGTRKIQVFTPSGEVIATKNQSKDIQKLIQINGLIYMVYRDDANVELIPVLEYAQSLDYETIIIEDVGAGEVVSSSTGIYYVDYSGGISLVACDIMHDSRTVVVDSFDSDISGIWSNGNYIVVSYINRLVVIWG